MDSLKQNTNYNTGPHYTLHSNILTDKFETIESYWINTYIYCYIKDLYIFRKCTDTLKNDWIFYCLCAWTILTAVLCVFVFLPIKMVMELNICLQNISSILVPLLSSFCLAAWAGVFLKRRKISIMIHLCFCSCIAIEVTLKLLSKYGVVIKEHSLLYGFIWCLTLSTGAFLITDIHLHAPIAIITVISCLRLGLNLSKKFQQTSPFLIYSTFLSGLLLARMSPLNIPGMILTEITMANDSEERLVPVVRQRQRRASSFEVPSNKNLLSLPTTQNNRRKSLPVLSLQRKMSGGAMDMSILGEAHGMITDLLADSSLPMNAMATLRIVADMISPVLHNGFAMRPSVSNPLLTMFEKQQTEEDEAQVLNQPDLKDDTPLSLKQRLQRNLGVSSRRMSSSYTTTTSATGMPSIDMEYYSTKLAVNNHTNKHKSYRSQSQTNISMHTKLGGYPKSKSFSEAAGRTMFDKCLDDPIFKVEVSRGRPVFVEGASDPLLDSSDEKLLGDGEASDPASPLLNRTKAFSKTKLTSLDEHSELEAHSLQNSTDKVNAPSKPTTLSVESNDIEDTIFKFEPPNSSLESETKINDLENDDKKREKLIDEICNNGIEALENVIVLNNDEKRNSVGFAVADEDETTEEKKSRRKTSVVEATAGLPAEALRRRSSRDYHGELEVAKSTEVAEMMSHITSWDFPIFELNDACNVLTQLALHIFRDCGFFNKFKIHETTFVKYFRSLENGYHNIPYHNRIHAADVLHGVYYFTKHGIPGFNSSNESESRTAVEEYGYGCLCDVMPDIELMALYTAAAMHDFDHPGRTNAFLVATLNSKAILYNDRSVLENHHAAASWSLLVNPGMNFLENLDPIEFKRFRFMVIEEILSTDLKKHFDFLTEWNAKVSDQGVGLNYSVESDRLLVGQMAIKLADIAGPSKEWDLHCRWTERIVEEFYQQGEDERDLGMSLSAYMDRHDTKVPQLQESFIKHLVSPLYGAYEKAGIMPGEWVEAEEVEEEGDSEIEEEEAEEGEEAQTMNKKKVPFSVVIDNIQKNHQRWLKVIADKEGKAETSFESTVESEKEEEESL